MKVIISGGGTGGHIYPALAIINKIKKEEPNSQFLYIGTHNRMEKDLVPKYGFNFASIKMFGFSKRNILNNFKAIFYLIKGIKKSKKLIKDFDPDIVIGVGGYVTFPVLYAGYRLKKKTFIHEQNSVPGKVNLFLGKFIDKVGTSFESSNKYFDLSKVNFTGNPCSEEAKYVIKAKKTDYNLSEDKKLVLIVMGSLGSYKVNEQMKIMLKMIKDKDYEVVFITGENHYNEIKKIKFPDNVKILPYVDDLPRLMKATDVMISRAGATTMSEIISLRVPTIFIPSPYVAHNHQFKNAEILVEKEAAKLIKEKNLKPEKLILLLEEILNDDKLRRTMKRNLKQFDVGDSSERIYKILQEMIGKNK